MKLAVLGGSIVLLLILIGRVRLTAFLALLITSMAAGIAAGLSPDAALKSITKGIGDTMGSLALILIFGAILGKLIEESGAAHTICRTLTRLFGERRLELSVLITGFLVGLPMIYNASFLVLIPLIYTLSTTTGRPLLALGIPLSAALSVTHGYLPPHPAPTSIAILYKADVGRTLLYGLALSVPAVILAGPVLARFFRHLRNTPPASLFQARDFPPEELPGATVSVACVLTPVALMLVGSDPAVALFAAAMLALVLLGWRRGRNTDDLMKDIGAAVASVSMILLIIASGGAFKQVLIDSGTGDAVKNLAAGLPVSPLILAWSAAALFRAALGSATVGRNYCCGSRAACDCGIRRIA
jgi:H+/gluconate symporter-like permease